MSDNKPRINIDEPRWDQSTYLGRAKYYFSTTNPLNLFHTNKTLDDAKSLVERYRAGQDVGDVSLKEIYKAKTLYDSAFHPVTGEKMFLLGRMSCQVPGNMVITGFMMTFYKSTPAVVFWQWANQSFNAVVNYCNRSGSTMTLDQIGKSYVIGTTGAVSVALLLNRMVTRAPPLVGRLVPFAAVAAANFINVPAMRSKELKEGVDVYDDKKNLIGRSKRAALEGTLAVVISRVILASPSMMGTPIVVNMLDKRKLFASRRWLEPVSQILLCGFFLSFATPLACAIFSQQAPIPAKRLEPPLQEIAKKLNADTAYYNKGL